nr:low affinity iron permease family protein [Enterovirga rhinocerotis]
MAGRVPLAELGSQASLFTRLSQAVARWAGKPVTFAAACAVIVLWGPRDRFSASTTLGSS